MAKKILIEYITIDGGPGIANKDKSITSQSTTTTTSTETLEFPLTDDINLEVASDFQSLTEGVPLLGTVTNLIGAIAGASGSISAGSLNLLNLSNVQRWQRTHPIRLNLNLLLYTKDSAKKDVYDPMMTLMALTILSKDPKASKENPRYRTPGLNIGSIKQSTAKGQDDGVEGIVGQSKLIAIRIPGVIYLPLALVVKAVPTISKEETDSGYPLWATLNLEVSGLYPATADLLTKEDTSFGFLGEISNRSDFVTNEKARKLGRRQMIYGIK